MITSPATGKIIHHNDCTYCIHRYEILFGQTKTKKGKAKEYCDIDRHEIAPPMSDSRYCEKYRQINCECEACTVPIEQH